jgi:hypothetical protein
MLELVAMVWSVMANALTLAFVVLSGVGAGLEQISAPDHSSPTQRVVMVWLGTAFVPTLSTAVPNGDIVVLVLIFVVCSSGGSPIPHQRRLLSRSS